MNLFFVVIQAAEQFPGFLPLLLYFWCSVDIFFHLLESHILIEFEQLL